MGPSKKAVWGWALYDWANSAFATAVMAGFFPIFFKQYWAVGMDVNASTARLGLGNSLAGLLVALAAPLLGAIADRGSARKRFLMVLAYCGAAMTAILVLVPGGAWGWALGIYMAAIVGWAGANIFYDALLKSVAPAEQLDFVSSLGFAMGYLGGGLFFLLTVMMSLHPEAFGLADRTAAVRLAFFMVALWWAGFSLFTARWVPEATFSAKGLVGLNMVSGGLRQLGETFKELRHLKTLFLFLLAYWCYIDGVDTIIRMAVDYGLSLGFNSDDLIVALLIVQFVGFPAALLFGKLGQRWGVRRSIFLALFVYMGITLGGTLMQDRRDFFILAVSIGLVQGGLQALSRSYYARLIPPHRAAEFFGFYNMLGKFAAIIGPVLMGTVGLAARRILMPPAPSPEQAAAIGRLAARWSIGSILLLFVAGAVLFFFVNEEKGRREAAYLAER
jgi:UMF1 family MFS transporter